MQRGEQQRLQGKDSETKPRVDGGPCYCCARPAYRAAPMRRPYLAWALGGVWGREEVTLCREGEGERGLKEEEERSLLGCPCLVVVLLRRCVCGWAVVSVGWVLGKAWRLNHQSVIIATLKTRQE